MGAKTIAAIILAAVLSAASALAAVPASCRIYVDDGVSAMGHKQSIGSGVLVGANLVVTNAHVVADQRGGIKIHFPSGEWATGQVCSRNRTWDVAMIHTSPVRTRPIALGTAPPIGTRVWLTGFGQTGQAWDRQGTVRGYQNAQGDNQRAWFSITGPSRQGDSGGPVIGLDGRCLGLIWGTDGERSVAVRSGAIKYLLTQCSTGQCPTPQYRTVPGPTYGAPGPRYSQRQPRMPRMPTQAYPPSQPAAPYPEPATMGPDELIGLVKPPAAKAAPKVTENPPFTIKTGLDPPLRSIFNRDSATPLQQLLLMEVQNIRELRKIQESLDGIEALLGTKHEPKGE